MNTKVARARTFLVRLARSISCVAVYKLRFTLEKQEKIYIYISHSFLCIYNTIICFRNDFVGFLEYAHIYNINIYSRMWIFSYYVIFGSFSYVIKKTYKINFSKFFYVSGLIRSRLQHLTLSEVLVHSQIIVRNKSEPLDMFSSFCQSLDE